MRILVIEDELNYREVICDYLKSAGHTVYQARNGKQALNQLTTIKIDIIVSDIVMPEIEGIELIMRLRQSKIPIIAMSGLSKEAFVQNVLGALGISEYMQKPFSLKTLAQQIDGFEKKR